MKCVKHQLVQTNNSCSGLRLFQSHMLDWGYLLECPLAHHLLKAVAGASIHILTLDAQIFVEETYKCGFTFTSISLNWDGTGPWNPSSWMARASLSGIVHTMAAHHWWCKGPGHLQSWYQTLSSRKMSATGPEILLFLWLHLSLI